MPVRQLPIFPLPLVLFPGTPQLLHIFEPRYRQMLTDCMAGDREFGISWAEAAPGVDPEPEPGSIGCIAYVTARTELPDGRSNILTEGRDRYFLRRYLETDRLYRVAEVETFGDHPASSADTGELAAQVRARFERVISATSTLSDQANAAPDLSHDPGLLTFQVAGGLELAAKVKQEILEIRSVHRRLELLDRLLNAFLAELAPRAEVHLRARRNGKGGTHPTIVREA